MKFDLNPSSHTKPSTMSITQASPCFSGACGLCLNCCGSVSLLDTHPPQSNYARDLYKFSKGSLDKDYDAYWRKMHNLKSNGFFTNPGQDSLLAKEYGIGRYYNGEEYAKTSWKLLSKNDEKRCQMPQCQMFHEHTHEYQRDMFKNLPLYQSENATLCAVCIRENGVKKVTRLPDTED